MAFSHLSVGTSVIPNDVERYVPERFRSVPLDAIRAVKRPGEVEDNFITHEAVKAQIMHSGSYSMSPFSMNWNQHSKIYSIIAAFKRYSNNVVLSSCRVDAIARDPGLVRLIHEFGSTNLVCAVEGISSRVCNFLQKSLMDEELYVGLSHIIQQNFSGVKFYYIYTGLETDEDIAEFERHLQKIDELRRMHDKPGFDIRMSFTPLLSTLGTPLQYHGSKVQRSLKMGSNALFQIKHLCSRYGFGVRLSTSIASSDFSQMCEMLDRRGAGLFEYASLNGIHTGPRLAAQFYRDPVPVDKAEYDALPGSARVIRAGQFCRVTLVDRITLAKLYNLMNVDLVYPRYTVERISDMLTQGDGELTPEELWKFFPRHRREKLDGSFMKVSAADGDQTFHTYPHKGPDGLDRRANHMVINLAVDDVTIDKIKSYLPIFTNGVTFNDVIEDKDALYVFPSSHIKFHKNQHLGQNWKQYVSNRAYIFDSYCFADALARCVSCGACDSVAEVKAITTVNADKETGESSFHLIEAAGRDTEPYNKLLVEVRIEEGPPGAVFTKWYKHAATRAILRASDGALVRGHLGERFVHSRQDHRIKSETFKNIISGSLLFEFTFTREAELDQPYVDRLLARVNEHVTAGWSIANIQLRPADYVLRQNVDLALTTYRFDARKVGDGFTREFLEGKVRRFMRADSTVKYKSQQATGRFTSRTVVKNYDKDAVSSFSVGMGRTRDETVLRVLGRSRDTHPLIFLAGFLGSDTAARGYATLYGVEVRVEGFYASAKAGSVFMLDAGEEEAGISCACCGGERLVNVSTGLPFGAAPHERNPGLERKLGGWGCVECWADATA